MNKEKAYIRSVKQNQIGLQIIIALVGFVMLIIGLAVCDRSGTVSTVCVGLGTSLLTGGILSLTNVMLIDRKFSEKSVTEEWGLEAVYKTRAEMNASSEKHVDKMKHSLDMVGFGFRSLRTQKMKTIESKVKNGVKIRILTMRPDSEYLRQREREEHETEGNTAQSIRELAQWVEQLRGMAPKKENVQIRYYDANPLDFYFRVDSHLFTGPYEYGKASQQTISYEYRGDSQGFDYYEAYFEELWKAFEKQ